MKLPQPRGACSERLAEMLASAPSADGGHSQLQWLAEQASNAEPIGDDDIQVSLAMLYGLHYQGWDGVDERWEWHPALLRARATLESPFERALREIAAPRMRTLAPAEVPDALFEMTAPDGKPGLAAYLAKEADLGQWREFAMHRSLYQLIEADPHTWAIPRLTGLAKAALVEVQADEYGGGRLERMHSVLYARLLRALDLDDSYGAHVDAVPAVTLAWMNVMSLFGLHRRLRGAIVGHLAAYEMTSPLPCRLYGNGLRRLGLGRDATDFYDEHVEADAVHEQIAGRDLAGGLAAAEPELVDDIIFGAAAELALDDLLGDHVLGSWRAGRSSLR